MRLLGIDLGDKRIGLAIADTAAGSVNPFATVRREKSVQRDVETLRRIVAEQRIDLLVVGLPLDMSGAEGRQAARTLDWAAAVSSALGLPLTMRDERLSSERAERALAPPRRGRAGGPPTPAQRAAYRGRIDREAAAIILQDELDRLQAAGGEGALPHLGQGDTSVSEGDQ